MGFRACMCAQTIASASLLACIPVILIGCGGGSGSVSSSTSSTTTSVPTTSSTKSQSTTVNPDLTRPYNVTCMLSSCPDSSSSCSAEPKFCKGQLLPCLNQKELTAGAAGDCFSQIGEEMPAMTPVEMEVFEEMAGCFARTIHSRNCIGRTDNISTATSTSPSIVNPDSAKPYNVSCMQSACSESFAGCSAELKFCKGQLLPCLDENGLTVGAAGDCFSRVGAEMPAMTPHQVEIFEEIGDCFGETIEVGHCIGTSESTPMTTSTSLQSSTVNPGSANPYNVTCMLSTCSDSSARCLAESKFCKGQLLPCLDENALTVGAAGDCFSRIGEEMPAMTPDQVQVFQEMVDCFADTIHSSHCIGNPERGGVGVADHQIAFFTV